MDCFAKKVNGIAVNYLDFWQTFEYVSDITKVKKNIFEPRFTNSRNTEGWGQIYQKLHRIICSFKTQKPWLAGISFVFAHILVRWDGNYPYE